MTMRTTSEYYRHKANPTTVASRAVQTKGPIGIETLVRRIGGPEPYWQENYRFSNGVRKYRRRDDNPYD